MSLTSGMLSVPASRSPRWARKELKAILTRLLRKNLCRYVRDVSLVQDYFRQG